MDKRVKIFFVDPEELIRMLNGKPFSLPVSEQIPAGAVVENVGADWERRAIALRVHHESFDVVEDAAVPPRAPGFVELQVVMPAVWLPKTQPPSVEGLYAVELTDGGRDWAFYDVGAQGWYRGKRPPGLLITPVVAKWLRLSTEGGI